MSAPVFEILIDGQCPLCRHEAKLLRSLDRGRQRLRLTDITAPDFDAEDYQVSMDDLMGEIHGVAPGVGLVRGMDVFRRAYDAVGFGWLLAPTAWPGLRYLCDRLYAWFARHRLSLTGRRRCASQTCAGPAPNAHR